MAIVSSTFLNCEFVDGSGSNERLIGIADVVVFYLTYILYHKFFNFSMKFLWFKFGAPSENRTRDAMIRSHVLYHLS